MMDYTLPKTKKKASSRRASCAFCKQRHLKCDGNNPCHQCERRHQKCEYKQNSQQQPARYTCTKAAPLDAAVDITVSVELPRKKRKLPADGMENTTVHVLKAQISRDTVETHVMDTEQNFVHCITQEDSKQTPNLMSCHQSDPLKSANNVQPLQRIPQQRLSTGWLSAYARGVSMFTSSGLEAYEAPDSSILSLDTSRMKAMDIAKLVKTFVDCSAIALGCRYCANYEGAQIWAEKAYDVIKYLLISRRQKDYGHLTQALVGGMELLVYYFLGSDDFTYSRIMINEADQLMTFHRQNLATATIHRVYGLLVGCSAEYDDAMHWFKKARSLPLRGTNCNEVSGWVCLALMATLRPITMGDKDMLSIPIPSTQEEQIQRAEILRYIDECEAVVEQFHISSLGTRNEADYSTLASVLRAMLNACRAVLFWQCGYLKEALDYAAKTIHQGRAAPIVKLPYLLAYSYACQIARLAGSHSLLQYGLEILEIDAPMYPTIRRVTNELRKPVTALNDTRLPLVNSSPRSIPQKAKFKITSANNLMSPSTPPILVGKLLPNESGLIKPKEEPPSSIPINQAEFTEIIPEPPIMTTANPIVNPTDPPAAFVPLTDYILDPGPFGDMPFWG